MLPPPLPRPRGFARSNSTYSLVLQPLPPGRLPLLIPGSSVCNYLAYHRLLLLVHLSARSLFFFFCWLVARLLGCSVARLLGCSVARLLGCSVARSLGCSVARLLGCSVAFRRPKPTGPSTAAPLLTLAPCPLGPARSARSARQKSRGPCTGGSCALVAAAASLIDQFDTHERALKEGVDSAVICEAISPS